MEEITEIDLVLLDIAKIWDIIEERTRKYLSDIIVGADEYDGFDKVMKDINKEMKLLREYNN